MDNAGEIYFTPYKTSTITCNANIGKNINIDLSILFNNIEINENKYESIIWIQNLKGDNQYSRGIYPKKIRKSKKNKNKKNRFDNQVTIIYRITDIYMPNIKIFKNGNVQLGNQDHSPCHMPNQIAAYVAIERSSILRHCAPVLR